MKIKENMKKTLCVLCAVMAVSSAMPSVSAYSAANVSAAEASSTEKPAAPEIVKYKSSENAVKLYWSCEGGADGYEVYQKKGRKYKLMGETDAKGIMIEGLEAASDYAFVVRAYNKSGSKKRYSEPSEVFYTSTKCLMPKIRSVASNPDESLVKVRWTARDCDGYIIYCYDYFDKNWVAIGNIEGGEKSGHIFSVNKAEGDYRALRRISAGGLYGYRMGIKAYRYDKSGKKVFSESYSMDIADTHYNINTISKEFRDGIRILSKAKKGRKGENRSYTYYQTTTVDGKTTTKAVPMTISDVDLEAIKAFEKKYFDPSWSDEQKLAFTLNWINKNVDYDYDYKVSMEVPGFANRIFNYRTGQCDSYNGTLVEMMVYLGYEGAYLHWYDAASGGVQHARAFIEIKGRKFSFEDGNARKSGAGWIWFCQRDKGVDMGEMI